MSILSHKALLACAAAISCTLALGRPASGQQQPAATGVKFEVKGAAECSVGVDGCWVYINQGRVNLGGSGPKEMAPNRVMTEAGPSNRVFAKL